MKKTESAGDRRSQGGPVKYLTGAILVVTLALQTAAWGDDDLGPTIEAQPATEQSATAETQANTPAAKFREFTGKGINNPGGLAVDGSGNVWVANHGSNSVTEIPAGATKAKSLVKITGGGLKGPAGVAVDSGNNIWVTNEKGNSVTELPAGNPKSPVNFTNGGMSNPFWNRNRSQRQNLDRQLLGRRLQGSQRHQRVERDRTQLQR